MKALPVCFLVLLVAAFAFPAVAPASPECLARWSAAPTPDGPAVLPAGIALDLAGDIYLTDAAGDRVLKFRRDGVLLGAWGVPGNRLGELRVPTAVVVLPSGDVAVVDTHNDRIQVFGADGTPLRAWGRPGRGPGEFRRPHGIAVTRGGDLLVTDALNERVQRFTPLGEYLGEWPTGNVAWPSERGHLSDIEVPPDPEALSRPAPLATRAQHELLRGPAALAADGDGFVYVLVPTERRVLTFTEDGAPVRAFGVEGSGDGGLLDPQGIAVDGNGIVYVADTGNRRMQMFTATGVAVGTWDDIRRAPSEGTGRQRDKLEQFSAEAAAASAAGKAKALEAPVAVAIDSRGHLVVADRGFLGVLRFAYEIGPARLACVLQTECQPGACILGCGRPVPLVLYSSGVASLSDLSFSSPRVAGLCGPSSLTLADVGDREGDDNRMDGLSDLVMEYTHEQIRCAACLDRAGAMGEITVFALRNDGAPIWGSETVIAKVMSATGGSGRQLGDIEQFRYVLPASERVRVSIFDVNGRLLETLVDGVEPAGERVVTWNAAGRARGVYFYRVESASMRCSGRIMVLR